MLFKTINIIAPAILGLWCLFAGRERKWLLNFLSAYFLYTALGELIGLILDINYPDAVNVAFYDQFFIPSLYFLMFGFYYKIFTQKTNRIVIAIMSALYLICFLIEKFVMHYMSSELSYYSYCFGSLMVVILCLLYFNQLIKSSAILYFKTDLAFWFSAGNLFFQLFTFPFFALMDLWFKYPDVGNAYYHFSIYCIYISYLFYAIGLLCLKQK